ncbi:hypothetical protein QF000_004047 [Paraburkholderia atlantica]|uniref:Uncharacterized protein n=1 Tax=Paraburkholderia atlantica TaxID=2654982 RepID=A0A6I1Q7L1_PARAM|nr:hypothetical protein [Paraburkholderia atlantica]MBB5420914.1 hypothetical protein [Paraburkholderia atlantica]MBB5423387.1 hypothetical protein [Paraburkholderia atlantica]MPW10271.1 hypothetical protein [Paraburkholderia atlantica]NUY34689.1 hypothetical protein [Paraburkholderia atlantica]
MAELLHISSLLLTIPSANQAREMPINAAARRPLIDAAPIPIAGNLSLAPVLRYRAAPKMAELAHCRLGRISFHPEWMNGNV